MAVLEGTDFSRDKLEEIKEVIEDRIVQVRAEIELNSLDLNKS